MKKQPDLGRVQAGANATLSLAGLFCLRRADTGAQVPIRAAKGQALLALVATGADGRRARAWLQAKLWSDRSPDQAAANLRQALSQVRRDLKGLDIGLDAARGTVSLDLSKLRVTREGPGEFLEGLKVRDAAFEDWLATQRAPSRAAPSLHTVQRRSWTVELMPRSADGDGAWFEHLVCDAAAKTLTDILSAQVVICGRSDPPIQADPATHLRASVQSFGQSPRLALRITLIDVGTRHQIWSGTRRLQDWDHGPTEQPQVLGLVAELAGAAAHHVYAQGQRTRAPEADTLCGRGIAALFSMQPDRVAAADQLFAAAHDADPRGLYQAWRAQLRTIQFVEQHGLDTAILREEGARFAALALEAEPQNAMVTALAANTAGHLLKQMDRSYELGRHSVRLDPANPMGWWAMSSASMYANQLDRSQAFALKGRQMVAQSPHRFWWDQQVFGAAFMRGQFEDALRLTRSIHAQNPNFRPPLRYLFALLAHDGQHDEAARVARRLSDLETDFSAVRMLEDHSYPASLVRRVPGLNLGGLRDLG